MTESTHIIRNIITIRSSPLYCKYYIILSFMTLIFYILLSPSPFIFFFFFNDPATPEISPLPLPAALPIFIGNHAARPGEQRQAQARPGFDRGLALHQLEACALCIRPPAQAALRIQFDLQLRRRRDRSEEHTSELQSRLHLVCRLLLEKKKH